jgi:hypothetical protein
MPLTFATDTAREACAQSTRAFVRAAEATPEYDLLGASRCHGWTRLDVVVHVIAGWHDMLGGLVSPVDEAPTVDAASYWNAFQEQYGGNDAVDVLMSQRRRTAAYARPASALQQLRDVADALLRGVAVMSDRTHRWQGHVFTAGDFLAVWAVENAVHHLDLLALEPVPAAALATARQTVEAIVGQSLPEPWTDEQAVLVGTGRLPPPDEAAQLRHRLPAFS